MLIKSISLILIKTICVIKLNTSNKKQNSQLFFIQTPKNMYSWLCQCWRHFLHFQLPTLKQMTFSEFWDKTGWQDRHVLGRKLWASKSDLIRHYLGIFSGQIENVFNKPNLRFGWTIKHVSRTDMGMTQSRIMSRLRIKQGRSQDFRWVGGWGGGASFQGP